MFLIGKVQENMEKTNNDSVMKVTAQCMHGFHTRGYLMRIIIGIKAQDHLKHRAGTSY